MILCAKFHLSHGEDLDCNFKFEKNKHDTEKYACVVRYLENINNDLVITGYTGEHLPNESELGVKFIYIYDTNTKHIPSYIGLLFSLTDFTMMNTQLVEIKANDFKEMENMENLCIEQNDITHIPTDTFRYLVNLQTLSLMGNKIKEMQNGVFYKNLQLEYVNLIGNNMKYLGSRVFHGLKKLKEVEAVDNICLFKNYKGAIKISSLKRHISKKCKRNNELQKLINENYELRSSYANLTQLNNNLMHGSQKLTSKVLTLKELKKFNVTCDFEELYEEYVCKTRNLVITHENMKLDTIIGKHLDSRSNEDVTELILSNSYMPFLSSAIFKQFPNVETVRIQDMKLKKLKKGVFKYANKVKLLLLGKNNIKTLGFNIFQGITSLKIIMMNSNGIENISIHTFNELVILETLSLKDNLIKEIRKGTFKQLVNLKTLILSSNKIQFLDGNLLKYNKKLISVSFDRNHISVIGTSLLDYTDNLNVADFLKNWCIDGSTDDHELNKLVFMIKQCCGEGENLNYNYNCGHYL